MTHVGDRYYYKMEKMLKKIVAEVKYQTLGYVSKSTIREVEQLLADMEEV